MENKKTIETPFKPDSLSIIEQDQLICIGMYEMNRENDIEIRKGMISLYTKELELFYQFNTNAVLDIFCIGRYIFTAESDSKIGCYQLLNENEIKIKREKIYENKEEKTLCLSVDSIEPEKRIVFTKSDGIVGLIEGKQISTWKAHEYETWSCYLDRETPDLLYTAGNDYHVNVWDLKGKESRIETLKHPSGVCSVFQDKEKIYSGCYDGCLRSWDKRNLSKVLKTYKSNGGVWRIKQKENKLLLACISDGAIVLDKENFFQIKKEETESLCYGIGSISSYLFATDFYQKKIHRTNI